MNSTHPKGPRSDGKNAPQLPGARRPRIRIEKKQADPDNNGSDPSKEKGIRARRDSFEDEPKAYKTVVRKKPKPSNVDAEAGEQIAKRDKVLANRAKKANKRNDNIELDSASDNETNRDASQPSNLAKRLSNVFSNQQKSKPVIPTAITPQKSPNLKKKRKSLQDEDLYDLPDYSRTNSEIERELEDSNDEDEEEGNESTSQLMDNKNLLCLIIFAVFILVVAVVATTLGITLSCKSGKSHMFIKQWKRKYNLN